MDLGAGGEGSGFGICADGFFSSGEDTLGKEDAVITIKKPTRSVKTESRQKMI